MKPKLKKFSVAQVRKWKPCVDPSKYVKEGAKLNALHVLQLKKVSYRNKLWVIFEGNTSMVNRRTQMRFALWCARSVEHLMKDQRSKDALDTLERYIDGHATKVEMKLAIDAAATSAAAAAYAAYTAAYAADAASYASYASAYAAYAAYAAYFSAYSADDRISSKRKRQQLKALAKIIRSEYAR